MRVEPRPGRTTGFTLIELLIVVGIISILAAIATPNFLEAQTRAKVSRVMNDQRVLATALESYAVDHSKYPYRTQASLAGGILPFYMARIDTRLDEMKVLTTPIAYISSLPRDIFNPAANPPLNLIEYWSPDITKAILQGETRIPYATHRTPGYALVSVGPDASLGYWGNVDGAPSTPSDPARKTLYTTYDPTNGTVSFGNIFRLQSGAEAHSSFSN